MDNDEIQAIERALGAIRLIRDKHRSGEQAQRLSLEILDALRGDGKSLCRMNVAEALGAALLNKSVETAGLRAA